MVFHDVDPIKQVTVLDVQWSNIPEPVYEAVREYWRAAGLGNDYYYSSFNVQETLDDFEEYGLDSYNKVISDYLTSRGVEECLLHFWW